MADEPSTTTSTEDKPAGGAAGASKGKGPKWLRGKHRTEILVMGGAAVVLLIIFLMSGRKGATSAQAAAPTQMQASTARAQAGGLGTVAGSDAQAVAGFQTLLANQADTLSRLSANVDNIIGDKTTPQNPAIAASLFAPQYTGQYVRDLSGDIAEVQSDGSYFHLTPTQWIQANDVTQGSAGKYLNQLGSELTGWYDTAGNLKSKTTA